MATPAHQPFIELAQGDITVQNVDAIVNAANGSLNHGGGVAAAIARAAGERLHEESLRHPYIQTGDAGATSGGDLKARFVIHAVGPVWHGGEQRERELLSSAYRNSVAKAAELGCQTVAFPSISTGIFGFPLELAAPVAIGAVQAGQREHPSVKLVRFCLFSDRDLAVYRRALTAA